MRLINSEDVKALINGWDSLPWEEEVDELIDRIPTAFDVDEVIKQIRVLSIREFGEIRTEDVLDIIKAGGIDD